MKQISSWFFFGLHEILELLNLLLSDLISLVYRYWDSLWAYYCYGIGSLLYTWLGCEYENYDTLQSHAQHFIEIPILIYIGIYVTVAWLVGSHGLMCLLGLCLLHWPLSGKSNVEKYFPVKALFYSYISIYLEARWRTSTRVFGRLSRRSSQHRVSDDRALLRAIIPKLSFKLRSETTDLNLPMNDQTTIQYTFKYIEPNSKPVPITRWPK